MLSGFVGLDRHRRDTTIYTQLINCHAVSYQHAVCGFPAGAVVQRVSWLLGLSSPVIQIMRK